MEDFIAAILAIVLNLSGTHGSDKSSVKIKKMLPKALNIINIPVKYNHVCLVIVSMLAC